MPGETPEVVTASASDTGRLTEHGAAWAKPAEAQPARVADPFLTAPALPLRAPCVQVEDDVLTRQALLALVAHDLQHSAHFSRGGGLDSLHGHLYRCGGDREWGGAAALLNTHTITLLRHRPELWSPHY